MFCEYQLSWILWGLEVIDSRNGLQQARLSIASQSPWRFKFFETISVPSSIRTMTCFFMLSLVSFIIWTRPFGGVWRSFIARRFRLAPQCSTWCRAGCLTCLMTSSMTVWSAMASMKRNSWPTTGLIAIGFRISISTSPFRLRMRALMRLSSLRVGNTFSSLRIWLRSYCVWRARRAKLSLPSRIVCFSQKLRRSGGMAMTVIISPTFLGCWWLRVGQSLRSSQRRLAQQVSWGC